MTKNLVHPSDHSILQEAIMPTMSTNTMFSSLSCYYMITMFKLNNSVLSSLYWSFPSRETSSASNVIKSNTCIIGTSINCKTKINQRIISWCNNSTCTIIMFRSLSTYSFVYLYCTSTLELRSTTTVHCTVQYCKCSPEVVQVLRTSSRYYFPSSSLLFPR